MLWCQNRTKPKHILQTYNAAPKVLAGGTYTHHWALDGEPYLSSEFITDTYVRSLDMTVVCSFETSGTTCQKSQRHVTEDSRPLKRIYVSIVQPEHV